MQSAISHSLENYIFITKRNRLMKNIAKDKKFRFIQFINSMGDNVYARRKRD